MCFPSAGNGSDQARQMEQQRQGKVQAGMAAIDDAFSGFNDAYYADFEKKNLDMAKPNIETQAREANDKTLFSLARSGNLGASTAAKQYGDVATRNDQALLQASDTARAAANGLRGDVEGERSNLVSQLQATGNDSAAAASAASQAAILSRPPTYSPITNIFADVTGQLASNEQARRLGLPGYGFGMTSPGVTSPTKGASVTTV
jgi:hypothetical protein